ncbi:MAG: hypothetical protein K6A67_05495 [Bacteroidales bacterium]|nr:hypothetical protein [Bacteroidales bacterium]
MDLLDKIIMDEANSVTAEDFERMTGEKLEAYKSRMKDFVDEVKAKVTAGQEQDGVRVIRMAFGQQKKDDEALPMAASAKKGKKK